MHWQQIFSLPTLVVLSQNPLEQYVARLACTGMAIVQAWLNEEGMTGFHYNGKGGKIVNLGRQETTQAQLTLDARGAQ